MNREKGIYQFLYDKLESLGYDRHKITMCNETTDMLTSLGLKYVPLTCNCYGIGAF
jgi:hypothetical protein